VRIFSKCPKCQGSLYIERDQYGARQICRHCGWQRDLVIGQSLPLNREDADADRPGFENGSNVSPSCFECPLPDCLYEKPITRRTLLWDQTALALFAQHQHLGTARAVVVTARELGVSERRVYRMLQRQRSAV
jgi:hypothetical protein